MEGRPPWEGGRVTGSGYGCYHANRSYVTGFESRPLHQVTKGLDPPQAAWQVTALPTTCHQEQAEAVR